MQAGHPYVWYVMTPIYAFAWDYDAAGNRIYQKRGNQETYYTYDAGNALIQKHEPGTGYSYYQYDSRGNCTLIQEPDGNVYFTYNHANLVTSIHHKTGAFNYFYYDSQLHRYAIEDSNGLAYFTWDSNGLNLLAEKDASGNTTAQYTHGYTPIQGIGSLVEAKKEIDSCTYQYPIYDNRGTVVKLVDENAQTIEKYHYNAWGFPFQYDDKARNRFGWQSNWIQLPISNAELLLSPTRIYSAKDGIFLQRDMLGFRDGLNLYEGFANIPVNSIDVYGFQTTDEALWFYAEREKTMEKIRKYEEEREKKYYSVLDRYSVY